MQSQAQLLGRLHAQYQNSGDHGVACIMSGSPGAGKTHLAERFLDQLPPETPRLRGRGFEAGVSPLLPICEALRTQEGSRHGKDFRAAAEDYLATLPLFKYAVGPLLRTRKRTEHASAALQEVLPTETFTFIALTKLLTVLAGDGPLVLFIDDLQWIDASSVAFLGYLAGQLRERQVFLLLATRANGHIDANSRRLVRTLRREIGADVHELCVAGLARAEQQQLIEAFLGPIEFSDEQLDWLADSSQAKPYYLRELIELLRARASIAKVRGVWTFIEEIDQILVPPSLQRYVQRRLDHASDVLPLAHDLIRLAACAGTRFDAQILAGILNQPELRVAEALRAIEDRTGMVHRVERTTHYRFDHDLTREAILMELGDFAPELHGKLATAMAARDDLHPSVVAHQFEAAGERRGAARWYLEAARRATGNAHFEAAVQYARGADGQLITAGLAVDDDDRLASASAIGHALFGAERYTEVISLLDDRVRRFPKYGAAPLLRLLGRAESRVPDAPTYARAVEHLRGALEVLPEATNYAARAQVWSDLVNAYDACGDFSASESAYGSAMSMAMRARDEPTLVRLGRLSCIFLQPKKVVDRIEGAIEVARRLGLTHELALCENNLGSAHLALRELEAAHAHYAESDRLLRGLGGHRRDTTLNNLALVKLILHDVDNARKLLHEAQTISRDPHSLLFIQSNLGALEGMTGQLEQSVSRLQAAALTADESGDLFYRDCIRHNLAVAHLELGRPDLALAAIDGVPVHHSHDDEALVEGKRARLLIRALETKGSPVPQTLVRQAEGLARSTKPQRWLYEISWYLCDIEFWED